MSKFPDKVIEAAQASEHATGLATCITLAQWADESGYGRSVPPNSNNDFGIKWWPTCGYPFVLSTTKEDNPYRVITAKFIKFPTIDAGFILHGKLLTDPKGPYAKCLPVLKIWQQHLTCIAKIYATDVHYAEKLLTLINQYKLDSLNLKK